MADIELDGPLLDCIDDAKAAYGGPVVIYDLRGVARRLAMLAARSRDDVRFLFSFKSLPFAAATALAARHLDGFDVANERELVEIARVADRKLVSVTGPSWHTGAFSTRHADEIVWNAATEAQLGRARELGGVVGVRLRADLAGDEPRPTSRFGWRSLDDVRSATGVRPSEIGAIHVHRGWGDTDVGKLTLLVRFVADELARSKADVRFVNLGGGLQHLGFDDLDRVIDVARTILPRGVTLVFEPGEFCAARCGFALCRVIDCSRRGPDDVAVVVDASDECHFKWSRPTFLLPQAAAAEPVEISLWGATCYERDLIGRYRVPAARGRLEPGTFVLLGDVTGYSAAWAKGFNGIEEGDVRFFTG